VGIGGGGDGRNDKSEQRYRERDEPRGFELQLYRSVRASYSGSASRPWPLSGPEFTKMGINGMMAPRKGKTNEMRLAELAATRQIAYLTKEEVERLFAAIPAENARDRLLFDVIYRYGLRRTEAARIRREHLKDGRIWITRLKGGISGEYPIHPTTRRLLWTYLAELADDWRPYLFVSRQSDIWPISDSTIYALFRRYAEAAELALDRRHPHVLRHSIAVHLMNAGWDASDVQDWLGHRDIASTMIYAAVTNKRREAKYEEALLSSEIANNAIADAG
jgi:site-specific recombinase XerD